MTTDKITWRALMEQSAPETDLTTVSARLNKVAADEPQPLLLRAFSGIGAWFTAFFVLLFFGLFGLYDSAAGCTALGLVVFGGALALSRVRTNVFVEQCCLAGLLSGNALLLAAVAQAYDGIRIPMGPLTVAQFAIAIVAALFYRGTVGCFICMLAAPVFSVMWAVLEDSALAMQIIIAVLSVLVGAIFGWRKRPARVDVLGEVALVSLLGTVLFAELVHEFWWFRTLHIQLQPHCIPVLAALLWLVVQYAGGMRVLQRPWFWLTVVAIVLLATFTTPGLLVALLVLLIGRAEDSRIVSALGYLFLTAFLVLFYYSLQIDLAHKSWLIAGSGVILFAVRWIAGILATTREEPAP